MEQLKRVGRTNILYALAKGLGTLQSCGTESLFRSKRLITDLFEHCVNFFISENAAQVSLLIVNTIIHFVSCPKDYRAWLQSMYSLFGNKWLNLYSGPMWKVEATEQGNPLSDDLLSSWKIENINWYLESQINSLIFRLVSIYLHFPLEPFNKTLLLVCLQLLQKFMWWLYTQIMMYT